MPALSAIAATDVAGEALRAELLGGDVEDLRLPVQAGDALGAGVGSDHVSSLAA